MSRKIAVVEKDCVACGSCVPVCPKSAITVFRGVYATVDPGKCVGCGKCTATCPANVISLKERTA